MYNRNNIVLAILLFSVAQKWELCVGVRKPTCALNGSTYDPHEVNEYQNDAKRNNDNWYWIFFSASASSKDENDFYEIMSDSHSQLWFLPHPSLSYLLVIAFDEGFKKFIFLQSIFMH